MNFPSKSVMPRYIFFAVIFLLVGIAVVAKVGYLMTARRGFWMEVDKRFVRTGDTLWSTRGNILSANGEILAASIPEYELYMDFMSYEKKDSARRENEQYLRDSTLLASLDTIAEGMARIIPGTTAAQFRDRILQGRARASHHWKLYNRRVTHVQYTALKQLPVFCKGVGEGGFTAERFFKRKNPYGRLGIHTIGEMFGAMDKPRSGLELSFDSLLRGTPGLKHRQRTFNTYADYIDRPAIDGCDVHTTMDVNMQDIVEEALRDKLATMDQATAGMCILMDVPTGDVKAMVSLTRGQDGHFYYWDHRALSQLMEPGSVFKPMSWLVALDDGELRLTDMVDAHGGQYRVNKDAVIRDASWRKGGPGKIPAIEAIERSSNVAVGTTIDRIYHNRPWDFVAGLDRIGVREDLHLQLPGYAKPRIRMPKKDLSNWSSTALAWMSFGYETQIPPITTVTFYNGIANGGRMVKPRFVTHVTRGDETVEEYPVEAVRERMAKPEAVADIQKCLSAVVKGKHATAKQVRSKLFEISGKTGTAQIYEKGHFVNAYLVSFVGYFPSDAPQYSMIVCVQSGGSVYGGSTCGPVFKRIAETVMSQRRTDDLTSATDSVYPHTPTVSAGNLTAASRVINSLGIGLPAPAPPADTDMPLWGDITGSGQTATYRADTLQAAGLMPDVTGYGLRDAVFRLESLGLRVKAKGVGYVGRQSVAAGKHISRGDTVYIYLGNHEERRAMADSVRAEEAAAAHRADSLRAAERADSLKAAERAERAKRDSARRTEAAPARSDKPATPRQTPPKATPPKPAATKPASKPAQKPKQTAKPAAKSAAKPKPAAKPAATKPKQKAAPKKDKTPAKPKKK
ncbi:MAG: transpeptidase family protein [Bacteroidaceae bacterium]|nr:transpeptidase family protein [Bacteroidaceae bacterium]